MSLVGRKFNRWTVTGFAPRRRIKDGPTYWCECECGKVKSVIGNSLTKGYSGSCGCYRIDRVIETCTTHGMAKTRFFRIWALMLGRCKYPNTPGAKNYIGRGIQVYERWKTFENFRDDMLESYQKHCKEFGARQTSIERINNNGNYCKENCKWATRAEQARNTRQNNIITFNGKTQTITDWAKESGINLRTLSTRIVRNKNPLHIALTKKRLLRKNEPPITYKGKTLLKSHWAKKFNISYQLLDWRLKHWPIERAMQP